MNEQTIKAAKDLYAKVTELKEDNIRTYVKFGTTNEDGIREYHVVKLDGDTFEKVADPIYEYFFIREYGFASVLLRFPYEESWGAVYMEQDKPTKDSVGYSVITSVYSMNIVITGRGSTLREAMTAMGDKENGVYADDYQEHLNVLFDLIVRLIEAVEDEFLEIANSCKKNAANGD